MVNETIIEEFKKLIKQIEMSKINANAKGDSKEATRHEFRMRGIKRALAIIKKFPKQITSTADLKGVPDIGKGSLERIEEILTKGSLKSLSETDLTTKEKSNINALQELETVYGIGPKKAKEFVVKYGITSVDQLKKAHSKGEIELPDDIIMGLKYHGVYQENIPRKEMKLMDKFLATQAEKVDSALSTTICGSYRRGRATSNDIDVLLIHPDVLKRKDVIDPEVDYLRLFVAHLIKIGFIVDSLTNKDYKSMYRGFCKKGSNPPRRIDIRMIPYESYYSALLYFTGPDELNRAMRQEAIRRNMLLNEYGIYKITGEKKKKIKIDSEKDIFDAIGMKYLSPKEREKFYKKSD